MKTQKQFNPHIQAKNQQWVLRKFDADCALLNLPDDVVHAVNTWRFL